MSRDPRGKDILLVKKGIKIRSESSRPEQLFSIQLPATCLWHGLSLGIFTQGWQAVPAKCASPTHSSKPQLKPHSSVRFPQHLHLNSLLFHAFPTHFSCACVAVTELSHSDLPPRKLTVRSLADSPQWLHFRIHYNVHTKDTLSWMLPTSD